MGWEPILLVLSLFDVPPSDDLDNLFVFDVNGLYCYRLQATTQAYVARM